MTGPSESEARDFAAAFRSFLNWVHVDDGTTGRNEVVALIGDFLGPDGGAHSVLRREMPVFEHVNLQTALNAWRGEPDRSLSVHGIAVPPHWGPTGLQQLLSGEGLPPLRLSAPSLADLPNGPGSTLACLLLAALLVDDARGRYIIMVIGPGEHNPGLALEVAGLAVDEAQTVLSELDAMRTKLNVYRGHVLDVTVTPMGGIALAFAEVPGTQRADVVLPEAVLNRVERHALGVAEHREQLLKAGQHLKRGLLLFGPPAPERPTPQGISWPGCRGTRDFC